MSFKHHAVVKTRHTLQRFYRPVKPLVEALGLKPALRILYSRIDAPTNQQATFSIGATTAYFHADTVLEKNAYDTYQTEERPIMEDLLNRLKDGDVFYDIGAWLGTYSCLVGTHDADVTVVPFEPLPIRARRFKENTQLNGLEIPLHQVAISNESGTAHVAGDDGRLTETASEESAKIQFVHGDSYVASEGIAQPTVLKIDVEGGELDVLDGLQNALEAESCRLVYVEVHHEQLPDTGQKLVEQELEARGFTVTELHQRGGETFLRGEK